MMSIPCATVESFFRQANWQGLKIVSEDVISENVITNKTVDPHFALTVESFFSLHNWQGIFTSNETLNTENPEAIYPLTMTVGDFLQRIVWQGQDKNKKVNIASMPKISPINNLTPSLLNLNDLSDLL